MKTLIICAALFVIAVRVDGIGSVIDFRAKGDASGGSFTVNLEASPQVGQVHVLSKATAGNTLTLSGNGKTIGAQNLFLTVQYVSYTVQFNGTEWRIQ